MKRKKQKLELYSGGFFDEFASFKTPFARC